jgi:hypothetical protein
VRRELFETMLNKLYPEGKIEVVNYEILGRNQLNESGEWIKDTPAVFVGVRLNGTDTGGVVLTNYFTDFTGFEFSIYHV